MDILALVTLFSFLFLIGYACMALAWKYTPADYLFLVVMLIPLWLRGRLSLALSFLFHDRPFMGTMWVALAAGMIAALGGALRRGPRFRTLKPAFVWVVVLFLLSMGLATVLAPGMMEGFAKSVQANLMWMAAFVAALGLISLIPVTEEHHDRLVTSFVVVFGYVFPLIMILMAFFPGQFARFFEWEYRPAMVGGAFARARAPIGSGISAGLLALMALALAIAQVIRGRRLWFHVPVLFVAVSAMLLTLSRSVILALALFLVILFFRFAARNLGRAVILGIVVSVLFVPLTLFMASRYDLSRLLDFGRVRYELRYPSAVGAVKAFLEKPITGHGAGLFYDEVRLPSLLREDITGETKTVIHVAGEYSALEPHNIYLFVLVEYGLLGLIMFGAGLLLWLRKVYRARRLSSPRWSPISDAYWAAGLAWLVFLTTNSAPILDTKAALGVWAFFFMALHNSEVVRHQAGLVEQSEFWSSGDLELEAGAPTVGAGY